jgi:magnesium transporter
MAIHYRLKDSGLAPCDGAREAVWSDLYQADFATLGEAADLIGFPLPSREEQQEIELSSRLYVHDGVAVMTALIPAHTKKEQAEIGPVTFILTHDRLITLRDNDPRPFATYPQRAHKAALACSSATSVLLGLTDDIIARLADLIEYAGRKIEMLSNSIFRPDSDSRPDLQARLRKIGWRDELVTHVRDSLVSLERLLSFLGTVLENRGVDEKTCAAVMTQLRDIHIISEQAGFLMQKTSFLLDATLGLISIEQNAITKMFSIVAVVFLPPTLVASVYGMNFELMPELGWPFGYPLALALMVVLAVLPLAYFKRKGWF